MRSLPLQLAGKALRLSGRDRVCAIRALLWLLAAAAAVRMIPVATLARLVERIPPGRSRLAAISPLECEAAIRRAARVCPARCLPQATAAYGLLRRAGLAPLFTFGVRLVADRRVDAHAWVECQGVTVAGGAGADAYAPLIPPAPRTT